MSVRLYAISIVLFLLSAPVNPIYSQSLNFAAIPPVPDPDSLNQWLTSNPQAPVRQRLRAMLMVEHSYAWMNKNSFGTYFTSIARLIELSGNPSARASFTQLQARREAFLQHRVQAITLAQYAQQQFRNLRDTVGLIHAQCLIARLFYRGDGEPLTESLKKTDKSLQYCEQLLSKVADPNALLYYYHTRFTTSYAYATDDQQLEAIQQGLLLIQKDSSLHYARPAFLLCQAIGHYMRRNYLQSFLLNKQIAALYKPHQVAENHQLFFNMGNDCKELKRFDEAIACYQKAIAFAQQCRPVDHEDILFCYRAISYALAQKGDYRRAWQWGYKQLPYINEVYQKDNEARFIELESRYKLKERQQENRLLQQQQKITRYQNELYLTALLAVIILTGLFVFLILRLTKTNRKLRHVLQELQVLNQSRDYFIGLIAHDMRKPLISFHSLNTLISRLIRQKAYDDIKQVSERIDQAGYHIQNMLDNLLTWAIAQREPIPYQPESLLLRNWLDQTLTLYQELSQYRSITIATTCPPQLTVWADPNGLGVIIRNLVDNALKHTPDHGLITIDCYLHNPGYVHIKFSDQGQGLSTEKKIIFNDILSGRLKASAGTHGVGLGLLLIRDFVKRNHGVINLTNYDQTGTEYILQLPISIPD